MSISYALLIALGLIVLAVLSLRYQWRNLRRVWSEMIPSDDRRYLVGQIRRRTFNSVLMLLLAGLIIYAFASGGIARFETLANAKDQDPPIELNAEDKAFVKSCTYYLMTCLLLLFFVMMLALMDWLAISLYGRQQLRRIRGEQSALLERDLAVHRQQKENNRMRKR